MPSRSSSSMMAPSLMQRHQELQLQGPRPAPLKVSTATTGTGALQLVNKRRRRLHQQAPPPRQPVIIYVEEPRVVHAHPGEFKSVVQRLTGAPTPAPSIAAKVTPPLQLQPFPFQFQFPMLGGPGSELQAAPPPCCL